MHSVDTSQPTKVLITGVAGMIGSHMAQYLLDKGYEVYGIDDLSGGYLENIPFGVKFFCCDVQDQKLLAGFFKKKRPDYVYHFAAYAAEGLSPFIRNFNYSNNLLSSVNVINECVKNDVKKLIFTSSMAVYGNGNLPFTEDQRQSPEDPYGISKYAVEMDLKQAGEQFGLNYAIVRPHNVIGIRQNIWDKYRNVIGIWIRRILRGESITIFGDGEQKRAFSDVRFCLEPLEKLMTECNGQTFNIGADKEYTLNDVAQIIKEVSAEFDFSPKIEHLEARHEVKYAYCNHDKAKSLLGFKDETDLKQTIRELFVWAMKQEDREVKMMPYELEKGMYQFWKK